MADLRSREELVKHTDAIVNKLGLHIVETELDRPYGLSYRFAESDAKKFIDTYFADIKNTFTSFRNLSPKFLVLMPDGRLSWQYHQSRNEIWRVVEGVMGIKISDTNDEPTEVTELSAGSLAQCKAGQRHRLMALDDWMIVAEIWQHLNPNNPSSEADNKRLQDDYGRK